MSILINASEVELLLVPLVPLVLLTGFVIFYPKLLDIPVYYVLATSNNTNMIGK